MKAKLGAVCLIIMALFIAWEIFGISPRAQSPISITSPSSGVVEGEGVTFSVVYISDPSVTNLAVIGEFLGSLSQTKTASNTFSVTVPPHTRAGKYKIYVAGTMNGQIVASPPITIVVDTSKSITSLQVSPSRVLVAVTKSVHLHVSGMLSDGTDAFLNESPQISYVSANTAVATVDGRGRITGVAPGTTRVTVSGPNGFASTIAVLVPGLPSSPPILSPPPGIFVGPQQITINAPVEGAALYYTVDGSEPTTKSPPYTGPFTLLSTTTLNVLSVSNAGRATAWGTYTIQIHPTEQSP